MGMTTASSPSLFTAATSYYTGPITDSMNQIPANTNVTAVDPATHRATLSDAANPTVAGTDVFTLGPPVVVTARQTHATGFVVKLYITDVNGNLAICTYS